ncbi:TMV resistance protein N-like isoform X2 [Punica granatum]|uniref:TMV resistance protein N-like isoform X2 n=1 Tax=Punica granatum TaxID=22663 RepID=A0A6P8CAP3_PUNGR|nr:TMV resistance protein N-like isoform X2 [Punica granatum]
MAPVKLGGLDLRFLSAVAFISVWLGRRFLRKRRTEPDADPQLGRQGGSKQQMEMAPSKLDRLYPQVNAEAGHEYEVFLSFRGPDTRLEFTDNLYHRLEDAGVQTFRDDEDLRVGEEIGPELMRAIKQSKISIPIFSKGYASSKWCLKEVAEMVKLKGETKHVIMPIFLDVTPDEVKHLTGSYAKAFTQHKKDYDFETIQEWRNALQEVVKLKGLELKKEANGKHGEFIKKVLARVLNCLKKAYLGVTDILVGIDDHVEAVKTLLEPGKEGVQIVGIWGMGGIGKTTLAKVVYNQLLEKFESSCFLNDIRETSSQHKGLQYLQSKLLSDILNCEREDFANTDEGTQELKNRLHGKKAIILLDDVDQVDQLKALAGDLAWFSPESRIIVTTREKTVLDLFRIKDYELTLLSDYQAFELFCRHAFIKGSPTPDFIDLSRDIVRTTGRLPLALEVIGSSLSTSSGRKEIWRGTLKQLKKKPHMKVRDALRISYDGLDREQQEIFLNIACFFIGTDARIVKPMWDDCDFFPEVGTEILLLKSLIRITDNSKLWMHDQIRDLGREIVEQENYREPWLRSRLWHSEVAMRVLERQPGEGMTKVEAISLEGYKFRSGDHCIKDDQFMHLTNLRILQLEKAILCGNFEHLLLDLQWLSWQFCNSNPTPPTNLDLKNLIVLDLSRSMVSEDWAGWSLMKVAAKLKVLDLTECRHLTKTPDFSAFPALERLILRSCHNLVSVDPSIEQLSALVSLDIRGCTKLKYFPQLGSALTELLVDTEVFLSFRGPDIREGFIDNLYHRLKDAGVQTFRDDEELRVGEEIGPELTRAIKQSKIFIPIFSKGYVSSKWCLKEVAEMVKLKDETKHVIMPIFLDVTPDEVKHLTGSYAKAFTQHEKDYDFETIQEWRNALQEVVKLKGLEIKKEANGKHGEFIKKVLARVLNCLKKAYLGVTDILVGIDDHVEAVKTLLEPGKEGVQIVGIWGMGGIGKTTLAKVVYNQLLEKFESSCFLNDIRETSSQHKGLQYLQSKLLSDILNCEREDFANANEGTQELKNRLRDKKAIIILDDVDQVDQLSALAGDLAWFSPESRIIVTTREKTVLDLFRIKNIYEHTLLSEYQAFKLFCKHAFLRFLPTPDFVDFSRDIVRTTGGHPLTLEVIGSSLYLNSGRKEIWQGTLEKLKKILPSDVQEKLRLSYNGLD